ncbi:hypothetical protein N9N67_00110 [Bacteriovoracaceae bacterium]|nr:hypothetical protein [Bacteriovoracaceae bacterium]
MKLISLLIFSMLLIDSYAGSGAGSPFVQKLASFDYQMAFPGFWKVSNQDAKGEEGLFKKWLATNEPIVGRADKSGLKIEFLEKFPVNSFSDLYKVIKKRHPKYEFSSSSNVQISGWTSELIKVGEIYKNWEYYYIAPQKVVRISTSRKKVGFGVSHVEILLNSIRKISLGVQIQEAKFINLTSPKSPPNSGDKVCYELIFDYPKELQTESIISSFSLHYEKENYNLPINKKILKQRSYEVKTGKHQICFKIIPSMDKKDHFINSLDIELDGDLSYETCTYENRKLICEGNSIELIIPESIVSKVDKKGPVVNKFTFDSSKKILAILAIDPSDIHQIQIFAVIDDGFEQERVAVIFSDEINNGEVKYSLKRNVPPATIVSSVYFTDKSGNTSVLIRNTDSDLYYSFKQVGSKPIKTKIPIIGL